MTLGKFLRLPISERMKLLNVTREEWTKMTTEERTFILKMTLDRGEGMTDAERWAEENRDQKPWAVQ